MDILLIILAAAFSLIVAVRAYRKGEASEKELKTANENLSKKQDELSQTQKELIQLQKKYSEKTDTIIILQNELYKQQNLIQNKTEDIVKLQNENINELTGGKGFCIVTLALTDKNSTELLLKNNSEYNLYDISINFSEIGNEKSNSKNETIRYKSLQDALWNADFLKMYNVQSLNRQSTYILGKYSFKYKETEKRFDIFISQRNGRLKQQIILREKNNHWLLASRVLNENNNKEVFKEIAKGFLNANEKENTIWHQ